MDLSIEINQLVKNLSNKKCNQKSSNLPKLKTKICLNNFFSINELIIYDKIQVIPYYLNYFKILIDYNFVEVMQLGEKILEKIDIIRKNDEKIILLKYEDNTDWITFNDFLITLYTPKLLIFHVLETYSYLLNSLLILNDKNICFFNLSSENIVFDNTCGNKPFLHNFKTSLQINKLNEEYITNIIKKTTEFINKPLEVHVLFYLIENNLNTLSYSFIEEITNIFMENCTILKLFSQEYKDNFKEECKQTLKRYIDKPKSHIICDILENHDTWDNYSLSYIYLHIIGNISRIFSLKGTFISKFTLILSKNIHPDPKKRETIKESMNKYNQLYYEFTDWSYINSIPLEQLKKLHQVIYE